MTFRLKLAALINRFRRRKGPTLADQSIKVIMKTCTLHLDREETRELAPTPGATGPITLSGGAITKLAYRVFDPDADKIDPEIKKEPWRAFAEVTMLLTIGNDPQFEVKVDGKEVEPKTRHKAPGMAAIKHLSEYFPLLPRPYTGGVYAPVIEGSA